MLHVAQYMLQVDAAQDSRELLLTEIGFTEFLVFAVYTDPKLSTSGFLGLFFAMQLNH